MQYFYIFFFFKFIYTTNRKKDYEQLIFVWDVNHFVIPQLFWYLHENKG